MDSDSFSMGNSSASPSESSGSSLCWYFWIIAKKGSDFMEKWGAVRFGLTSFLFLNMIAVVIKMGLRLGLNVKYIMVTPWINI